MQIYDRIVSSSSHSKSYYEHRLKTATNYDEWCEAATKLDEIDGLDHWKREMASPDYDHELIKTRLDQLRHIRKTNKGQSAMIFALRTSLARNLGDMGNPKVHNPMFVYVRFSYLFGKHIALLIFTCRHKKLDL